MAVPEFDLEPVCMNFIRRLYNWTMELAVTPNAERMLAVVSFIESSIFPIPPDVMLIPMVLADRRKWIRYALVCTIASLAGALAGYAIGMFLYEQVAVPVLSVYGKADSLENLQRWFADYGYWAVLFAAITPFPFKVLTIFSGFASLNLPIFMGAAIIGRSFRFFLVSWLLYRFGAPIRAFIEKRLGLLFTLFMILLIGGFAAVRFVY
jgi:membrane protein YqaA with SNARE-associated domain